MARNNVKVFREILYYLENGEFSEQFYKEWSLVKVMFETLEPYLDDALDKINIDSIDPASILACELYTNIESAEQMFLRLAGTLTKVRSNLKWKIIQRFEADDQLAIPGWIVQVKKTPVAAAMHKAHNRVTLEVSKENSVIRPIAKRR